MIIFLQAVSVILVILIASTLKTRIEAMSAALDRLTTEVAENTNVVASAKAMIAGLAQQIRDAKGDEDKLNALADQLDSSGNDLAGAVAENTVAANEPAPADDGTGTGTPTDGTGTDTTGQPTA